jgi:hypothetical protein
MTFINYLAKNSSKKKLLFRGVFNLISAYLFRNNDSLYGSLRF